MFQSKSFKSKYGKGGRSAADYGILDMSDETLQELASNPGRYGEKSALAQKELAARRGLLGQADIYRKALEKQAYSDVGGQYGAGLGQITNYLAKSGPLADSGAATALKYKLASNLYSQANSRIGNSYADYLRQLYQGRNQYNYQRELMKYQNQMNKTGFGGVVGGIAGGVMPFLPSLARKKPSYQPYGNGVDEYGSY